MDPQTKVENKYDQNTLKLHKILILAPYVSTGARPVTKGGENEPEAKRDKNVVKMSKFQKHQK